MKPKTLIPLVIGLAVGFFAIKMGLDMVQKAKGAQEEKTMVLVAAKTIDSASGLTEQMLSAREVATSLVPPDSFHDRKTLVGRVTKMSIPSGVTITKAMLAPPGALPGLSAQIPAGHRAVSVKVNEETAVAGFITPGSRVDVYAVAGRTNAKGQAPSRMVLSNVEVGAVGQSLSRTGPDGKTVTIAKTVTLFLKPEEVQQLNSASAGAKGGLRLALRGAGNDPTDSFFANMLKKAMTYEKPKKKLKPKKLAQATPAPKRHVVELRRGQTVEEVIFDEFGNVQHRVMNGPNGLPAGMPDATLPSLPGAPNENDAPAPHAEESAPPVENIE